MYFKNTLNFYHNYSSRFIGSKAKYFSKNWQEPFLFKSSKKTCILFTQGRQSSVQSGLFASSYLFSFNFLIFRVER